MFTCIWVDSNPPFLFNSTKVRFAITCSQCKKRKKRGTQKIMWRSTFETGAAQLRSVTLTVHLFEQRPYPLWILRWHTRVIQYSVKTVARNGHALRTIFVGGKRSNAVTPWKERIHISFWMISSLCFPCPTASRSIFSSTDYIWDKGKLSHFIYISNTNRTLGLTFYGRTDEKSTIISFRAERFYDSACWLNVTKTIIGRRPATSWSDQVAWIYLSPSLIVCGF